MTRDEVSEVVELYADTVKRICFTYMKNEHEADDIFQTVFLKLMQTDITFANENHRKAWIIRVTVNCCKDSLKSFFRKNTTVMEEYQERYAEDADLSFVKDSLMKLSGKYRIVLFLFYYEEYSIKEIAEMLSCSENTVSTRLKRGREKMKMDLDKGEIL